MKLDLGCGKNKTPGFYGIDSLPFQEADLIHDLRNTPWPIDGGSVEEARASHFVEHLSGEERISFFNELWRVLQVGAVATIITPDWSHACAYGDPTHKWPPMSSWYPLYLNKAWREGNAPHVGYTCDFDYTIAGSWDEWLSTRSPETKVFAMQRYTNSQRDLIVHLTRRA